MTYEHCDSRSKDVITDRSMLQLESHPKKKQILIYKHCFRLSAPLFLVPDPGRLGLVWIGDFGVVSAISSSTMGRQPSGEPWTPPTQIDTDSASAAVNNWVNHLRDLSQCSPSVDDDTLPVSLLSSHLYLSFRRCRRHLTEILLQKRYTPNTLKFHTLP